MKILIDLQCCQSGSRLGGIGRYSMNLAQAIIRQGEEHDFYVLLNNSLPAENEVRAHLAGYLPQYKILTMEIPKGIAECYGELEKTEIAELIREYFILCIEPDVVYLSSLMEGFGEDVVTSIGRLFPSNKTAVTLYDLIPFVDSERYLTNHAVKTHCYRKLDFLKSAGMIMSISEFSKQEGISFASLDVNRIINISSAVDDKFKHYDVDTERIRELSERYGIKNKFLMFASSFDVRKNHSKLIEAFSILPAELRATYQLVIIGNGNQSIYEHYLSFSKSKGLKVGEVLFLGHVNDKDLLDLYNICSLFVFPSLREGFGLPVLEAMSCGVPTIGSNTTSIPEVLGRDDTTFDPESALSISNKIQYVLNNDEFMHEISNFGLKHAKNFSWDISAKKALAFIDKRQAEISLTRPETNVTKKLAYSLFLEKFADLDCTSITNDFLMDTASCIYANELTADSLLLSPTKFKIACVSTYNTKCGIASYTKQLLKNLNCDVKVYAANAIPDSQEDECNVLRCWNQGFDELSNLNDMLSLDKSEVLFIQVNYGLFDFTKLSKVILNQKKLGKVVIVTLHSTIDPPKRKLDRSIGQLADALNICDLVLVHTSKDVENLNKFGVKNNVMYFPQGLPYVGECEVNKRDMYDEFSIATFGFFLPHKGLVEIIEAVFILKKRGVEVFLEMLNAEYSSNESAQLIEYCKALVIKYGLAQNIKIVTEYLDDREVLTRLASKDLVVFPYQNTDESSSAAVRMALVSDVPVAVTQVPIFNEVRDVVINLPGTDPYSLANGIEESISFIKNKAHLDLMKKTKRWVRCHSFNELAIFLNLLIQKNISTNVKNKGLS